MYVNILYFAQIRERIGYPSEVIETSAVTLRDLVDDLRCRDLRYRIAFDSVTNLCCAKDQVLAPLDTPLQGAGEVAFFPPMTGG